MSTIPMEVWYGLGGLAIALVAQRIGIPLRPVPRTEELPAVIRRVLWEILQPPVNPTPAVIPVRPADDEALRQRLREAVK